MNSDIYSRLPVEELGGKDIVVVQSATLSSFGGETYTTQDRIFELLEYLSILRTPQAVMTVGHKQYAYEQLDAQSRTMHALPARSTRPSLQ
jgi:hypothetical protein